jgi:hypothetical protein
MENMTWPELGDIQLHVLLCCLHLLRKTRVRFLFGL